MDFIGTPARAGSLQHGRPAPRGSACSKQTVGGRRARAREPSAHGTTLLRALRKLANTNFVAPSATPAVVLGAAGVSPARVAYASRGGCMARDREDLRRRLGWPALAVVAG